MRLVLMTMTCFCFYQKACIRDVFKALQMQRPDTFFYFICEILFLFAVCQDEGKE